MWSNFPAPKRAGVRRLVDKGPEAVKEWLGTRVALTAAAGRRSGERTQRGEGHMGQGEAMEKVTGVGSTVGPVEEEIRTEAWRRLRIAYPTATQETFERAWPALRDGIIIE